MATVQDLVLRYSGRRPHGRFTLTPTQSQKVIATGILSGTLPSGSTWEVVGRGASRVLVVSISQAQVNAAQAFYREYRGVA